MIYAEKNLLKREEPAPVFIIEVTLSLESELSFINAPSNDNVI